MTSYCSAILKVAVDAVASRDGLLDVVAAVIELFFGVTGASYTQAAATIETIARVNRWTCLCIVNPTVLMIRTGAWDFEAGWVFTSPQARPRPPPPDSPAVPVGHTMLEE